ncbi:MAG TPA: biotin/lipoyl-containing protein, partial [Solirubrobacteraceae bacterium]|nr:biotin/lipoyl-containing protein [Solirubrobacteraceae bacterium]
MAEFLMPSLGADMEFGRVLEWQVKPGDAVKRGDIVAVVDTSKAEIEVEIFEDGVIDELLVPVGTRVPVGTVMATFHAPGEAPTAGPESHTPVFEAPAVPESAAVAATEPAASAPELAPAAAPPPAAAIPQLVAAAPPAAAPLPAEAPQPPQRPRVSPVARRVAERLGVDLGSVSGSGPDGAITKADVELAARAAEPSQLAAALPPAAGAPGPPAEPAAQV